MFEKGELFICANPFEARDLLAFPILSGFWEIGSAGMLIFKQRGTWKLFTRYGCFCWCGRMVGEGIRPSLRDSGNLEPSRQSRRRAKIIRKVFLCYFSIYPPCALTTACINRRSAATAPASPIIYHFLFLSLLPIRLSINSPCPPRTHPGSHYLSPESSPFPLIHTT